MISIIICCRNKDISRELRDNISSSVGADSEVIVIDNSANTETIFSAYNKGISYSKGDILCFMHDDVRFHSDEWGKKVNAHFDNDGELTCIGVVGTHFLPATVCGWHHSLCGSGGCIQLHNGNYINMQDTGKFKDKNILDAVAVDGMWFCIRRSFFLNHKFDEQSFKKFHCYDIDICLQVKAAGLKVGIISDVTISHDSYGSFNKDWYEESVVLFKKWESFLPVSAGISMSESEQNLRTDFVKQVMVWIKAYGESQEELSSIRQSHAYRIGKKITSLLKKISRR